jgi:putative oxidoreductase
MLSILRIVAALLFLEHGTQKILGFPFDPLAHQPALASMGGFSGILELVGGALLVLGLFTRVFAFILSGEMAVAYFMVHFPHSFFPIVSKGELAALYCFVFLYFAVAGGGAWSLDALLARRHVAT